ncbi:hypothetical protein HPB52_020897 [Rhipicephalus sanguineus]|uniref:Uncharacterized protein n=1 Tax=Rhipicephalus sanguineus TaxID=34632 RepID=A0A9D4TBN3_RHISA|nr:hypothetical protein HPB52_020897 [Rhipicephalus sanguineus]
MYLAAGPVEAKDDLPYISNILAIKDMLSKSLNIADKPRAKVLEGSCDENAVERRRRLHPRSGELLLLMGDKDTLSQRSTRHVICRVQGAWNEALVGVECSAAASPAYSLGVLCCMSHHHPRDTLPYLLTKLNAITHCSNCSTGGVAAPNSCLSHGEVIDDLPYMYNILAIEDTPPKNLGTVDPPWTKAQEVACDERAAERPRRLLPRSEGELLLLTGIKETLYQWTTRRVPFRVQGAWNQTAGVSRGDVQPNLDR